MALLLLLLRNLCCNLFRSCRTQNRDFTLTLPNCSRGSLKAQQSPLLSSSHLGQQFTSSRILTFWLYCCFWYITTSEAEKPLLWYSSFALLAAVQQSSACCAPLPWLCIQELCPWVFRKSLRQDYELLNIDKFGTRVILCTYSLLPLHEQQLQLLILVLKSEDVLNTSLLQFPSLTSP